MKKIILFAVLPLFFMFACDEDDEVTTVDSSRPQGTFSVSRSGDFVEQNGTGTQGMAAVGTDEDGNSFIRFNDSFQTNLATGTVAIFLSTSDTFMADPANGNPNLKLVGNVSMNGESYYPLSETVDSKYTHIILWCASANIPFGYAPLQ
ncbi:DM13 domain-containing protein [Porifericola rhodea]|uniref:DM13 domain-containing protein n=1 Tax=Porifericola rhodea TaxID=930972 RepID=UPI0026660D30|nr:DM13 domain-containing protein [Porifericola rhodea]WKN30828.1 DM13 domain-containing protein [Porifericola rhodea]